MCGICGFTGTLDNRDGVIKRMTDVITHRGPDSDGYYSDETITMGFRRLSIIDLEAGHQPIYNEDKTLVLTFNGEIYNYKQLREELIACGHRFATESDSEVLVHGFEEWQEDLLTRLRGMFAFAIYNTVDRSLFIARDFFGIKPMHYTEIDGELVYASEIKSILEYPGFVKRFNKHALDTYLSYQYAVPPETFFEDVYCLLPGHYLWYQNGVLETDRYFEPRFRPDENMTEDEAVDQIEKVFEDSVNAHKIADVEVGCFLSSGVDSSYVSTYFADQKTFTVGFDFGEKYNEISWAEELSRHIGVEHHTHLISSEEFWDAVPTVQYYMDQPLADPSCVALYFVSRLASKYVKVVLSGEGADELFGGYTCYNDPRVFRLYQKIVPHFLRKALRAIALRLPDIKGRDYVIRACDELEDRYIGNAFMYDLKQKQELLKDPSIATPPQRYTRRFYYRTRRLDDVTKMQYLDINMWMTGDILLKADRMSMANSLELRVPFLDKEVFGVASKLPTELRVNKQNTKYALRKAAARHMPEATAEKEKLGFPVPTRVWLRDEKYYNIVKEKFQSETAEKFFNTDKLVAWLDEHFSGAEDNSRRVWTIYVFLVWYDIYFNEETETVEKPENHLDELKALAEEKREQQRKAAEEAAKASEEAAKAAQQAAEEAAKASEEAAQEPEQAAEAVAAAVIPVAEAAEGEAEEVTEDTAGETAEEAAGEETDEAVGEAAEEAAEEAP
ncbi:MAG: asparagine synthase (glutamine-hydrolyzing), partial [Ruminococcus sp.]|nr:asparagine synthase (glutamine-hydrolyzing) [Ruminococcus sp.]